MPLTDEQRQKIWEVFEDFLERRIAKVKKLRIEDLNINPFLIRLLAAQDGLPRCAGHRAMACSAAS